MAEAREAELREHEQHEQDRGDDDAGDQADVARALAVVGVHALGLDHVQAPRRGQELVRISSDARRRYAAPTGKPWRLFARAASTSPCRPAAARQRRRRGAGSAESPTARQRRQLRAGSVQVGQILRRAVRGARARR